MEWNDIRFTLDAFKVIRAAQNQARELGHKYAGPEFLLLGLLQITSESHTFILNQFPLDLDAIHLEIINVIGIGFNSPRKSYKPAFTLKAKNIIAKAVAKAHRNKLGFVSSIYLLWSLLLDNDNLAVKILESLNINIDLLRNKIQEELDKYKASFQSVNQSILLPINQNLLLENAPKLSNDSMAIHHEQVPDYLKGKSPDEAEYIQEFLSCLEIGPTELKSMKKNKRRRYRAILQFLTDYGLKNDTDTTTINTPFGLITIDDEDHEKVPDLKTIEHYLQVFKLLWEDLKEYNKAILFLFIPLKHINNFKLCKQLHEWGYYEEEKDIYESILSINSEDELALGYGLYLSTASLLLARAFERIGQYEKAHRYVLPMSLFTSSPPDLISEYELKCHKYFDIYDNTNYKNLYYHYFFKTRLIDASILASLGLLGEAADEYEKCFNKSQRLEERGVTQEFYYTPLANLEIKINALLGCGDCYFKIKDYDNAIKRYDYAYRLCNDFMDYEDYDLILGDKNNHAILDNLFITIFLGLAQTYRVYKSYSDAQKYYEMALSSLKSKNKYFFQHYSLKRKILRIECLTGIGGIHCAQKRYQQAILLFEEALEIAKELEDLQGEAVIFSQLGNTYFSLKNYHIANDYYFLFDQKIRNCALLGYDSVVIYSNWSKVLRKLRKYKESERKEDVSLYFKNVVNRGSDTLKWQRRLDFESRKLNFELSISNPILRLIYRLWATFENGLYNFFTRNPYLEFLILLLKLLISIALAVLLLPIFIIITIWEKITESKD
jgi:tetratricopeptide (TPR) repeat protein